MAPLVNNHTKCKTLREKLTREREHATEESTACKQVEMAAVVNLPSRRKTPSRRSRARRRFRAAQATINTLDPLIRVGRWWIRTGAACETEKPTRIRAAPSSRPDHRNPMQEEPAAGGIMLRLASATNLHCAGEVEKERRWSHRRRHF
ncbi:hypothetical protein GUJ93_ZPchr0002g24830 [Zizania palustris]|uniref:Uncharacterized protein n=1 Tax=Zizania palustris TaxID=103762 RepID=A0A8J5VAP4_ZIZPA|nr:hypothetical protein GUJ93_ZPchr0002g24830 [Zizania palustris]